MFSARLVRLLTLRLFSSLKGGFSCESFLSAGEFSLFSVLSETGSLFVSKLTRFFIEDFSSLKASLNEGGLLFRFCVRPMKRKLILI